MRRRGFVAPPPPRPPRRHRLPVRLGGLPRVRRPATSVFEADSSPMDIWEDNPEEGQEFEEENDEMATVVREDIDQPVGSGPLQPIPSINLLGIDYGGNDDDMDEDTPRDDGFPRDENEFAPDKDLVDSNPQRGCNNYLEGSISREGLLPAETIFEIPPSLENNTPTMNPVPDTAINGPQQGSNQSAHLKIASSATITDKSPKLDEPVDDFHVAIMLFITAADLSTSQYEALVEVLALATTENIRTLPKSIRTLKDRCRNSFPLLDIKARPVNISLSVTPPKTESPRWAYYFDSMDYCRLWLSNPKLKPLIYTGLGQIVDAPTELWHGDAWMESVRSTSGKFARIQEIRPGEASESVVLLPSDCVRFVDSSGILALGRVKAVGTDNRSVRQDGVISAVINRLVPREELSGCIEDAMQQPQELSPEFVDIDQYPSYPSTLPELVLFESREIVPCSAILSRVWVYFADYESPASLQTSLLPRPPTFYVRNIIYMNNEGVVTARPVCKRHRVAAENELVHLTREVVISTFVDNPAATTLIARPKISLPYSVFLDGFGLYRNAYHSLKGMYITPAGLDVDQRSKLTNMFVLMIGPFGSNKLNMAECLEADGIAMGAGKMLTLESGDEVFVTAFPLLFTGDMPQQNQNSGNKTHNAEFGCRSCLVPETKRGELQLDIMATGRYRAPTQRLFKYTSSLRTKTARNALLQKYGLTAEGPYFLKCYPMLDPQRSNPNDSLHAELRLCKYYSEALLEGILSPTGIAAYREAWNDVEVPYRWGQPQNPVNHKGSMVFSEHGQMAVMNPFVLMHLFSNPNRPVKHSSTSTKTYLKATVEGRLKTSYGGWPELPLREPRLQILRTAYLLSKTVHLTLKRRPNLQECTQLLPTIKEMRIMLRLFFASTTTPTGKGGYQKYADVPNIHLALHYELDVQNFATTYNSTTMMGEQKHKVFKQHATNTNSHENDLQLLKATNTSQTIRFILDGTFAISSPRVSSQLLQIVDKCPVLKGRFLGCNAQDQVSNGSAAGKPTAIDVSESLVRTAKTGVALSLKHITSTVKQQDISALYTLYKDEYNVDLALHAGLRYRVHYWGFFAAQPLQYNILFDGQSRFRVKIDGFVRLRENVAQDISDSSSCHRVKRIFTVSIGTMERVFFVLQVLRRDRDQEIEAAPYPVFTSNGIDKCVIVGLRKIDPTIYHFVSKGDESWWYNPFVPYFL